MANVSDPQPLRPASQGEEVAPAHLPPSPEVVAHLVPGGLRVIWESLTLGLSQRDVRSLYSAGEMHKLKDVTLGLGFFKTREVAKVQVAIRDILLQSVPKGEDAPAREKVWEAAAELTQVVVMKEIKDRENATAPMEPGQTYKAKHFNTPYSVEYRLDGSMLIKLKPGKSLGIKSLGEGSFGKVTRAIQIDAGAVHEQAVQPVAHKREILDQQVDDHYVHNEYRMNLAARGCENVVKMHTTVMYQGPVTSAGEREEVQKIGMVFEFCNRGDMRSFLRSGEFFKLPEEERLRLFREVLVGVEDLHSRGIVHRDLKPANIMLVERDGRLHVRIGDLGLAGFVDEPVDSNGTPRYIAPEVEQGDASLIKPSMDYYALGVIANDLFGWKYDESGEIKQILPKDIPEPIHLLSTMTNGVPEGRPNIEAAIAFVDMRLNQI